MKIYTEVIMQWDEGKGKLVEVSSKSHEYNGDLALCGGGSSGRGSRQKGRISRKRIS